jgi:hypothetical protein
VDALLAFAAALLSLRLAAQLARRWRSRRRPELAAWTGSLLAYAAASAALAWGAAAGWSDSAFRVYYLAGGLLTAALLGSGSLLLVGRRIAGPLALLWVGLATGVMLAVELTEPVNGAAIPAAQDHLDFFPARLLAVVGNSVGTLAAVGVAAATIRRRPLGNALLLAGIVVAALGSALAGLGVAGTALFAALAALLLYGGFAAPSWSAVVARVRRARGARAPALAQPDPDEQRAEPERQRRLRDRAVDAAVREHQPRESSQSPPTV